MKINDTTEKWVFFKNIYDGGICMTKDGDLFMKLAKNETDYNAVHLVYGNLWSLCDNDRVKAFDAELILKVEESR